MPIANPEGRRLAPRSRPSVRRFAALLALVLTLVTPALVFAWSPDSFSSADEAQLVKLTNQARAAAGLRALRVDATLTGVARWRSKDMIDRNYFDHVIPPSGTKVFDELKRLGYCYRVAGENIGTNNFSDAYATASIEDGFMGSPDHRANILGSGYTAIGIGAYKGANGKHMWTVLFAQPCASAPTPTPRATPKPAPKPAPKPTAAAPATPRPGPTAVPTVTAASSLAPTSVATARPFVPDPAEASGSLGTRPRGSGPLPPGPLVEPTPPPASAGAGSAPSGLQVIDQPIAGNLLETIVGTVAGGFFGN